ncbi:MAG: hypothetical protein WDZ52_11900 [Pseudohongiellaceae bacterium]
MIALIIIIASWSLFRRALHLLFDGVPEGIELDQIEASLLSLPGVQGLHDLHVWAMSTEENALTVHLVCEDGAGNSNFLLHQAAAVLGDRFGIRHITLQCESGEFSQHCQTNPGREKNSINQGIRQ